MADDLFKVTLDEALAEIDRELAIRRQVYADLVLKRRMSRIRADSQITRMETARVFLDELRTMKGGNYVGHGEVA